MAEEDAAEERLAMHKVRVGAVQLHWGLADPEAARPEATEKGTYTDIK